ncbi:MAG: LysR family transcriptional regulator [Rhodobacteraceae bacterium]|nr:LysR family transcriptional regulator [Paracoccaceae bacterium]
MKSAINLRHLRAFAAVARDASFTRAAERLLLSQSALTVTVRQLEDHLGVALFNRTTRQVALTVDGETLLVAAERIIGDFERALADVSATARQRRGRVPIAVLPSLATRLMPALVRGFHEAYPDIRITLRDDNGRGVHRQVLDRDVELGICNVWRDYPELEFTPLTSDRFGLVCRRDDPLAREDGPYNWAGIDQGRLFIMAADTGFYTALHDTPEFVERCPTPAGEVLVMVTMLDMVRAGLGITLLPELARPAAVESELVFRRLTNPVVYRHLCLIRRRNEALSQGARRVWDYIRAQIPREVELTAAP